MTAFNKGDLLATILLQRPWIEPYSMMIKLGEIDSAAGNKFRLELYPNGGQKCVNVHNVLFLNSGLEMVVFIQRVHKYNQVVCAIKRGVLRFNCRYPSEFKDARKKI